jgi:hypothetical protein
METCFNALLHTCTGNRASFSSRDATATVGSDTVLNSTSPGDSITCFTTLSEVSHIKQGKNCKIFTLESFKGAKVKKKTHFAFHWMSIGRRRDSTSH